MKDVYKFLLSCWNSIVFFVYIYIYICMYLYICTACTAWESVIFLWFTRNRSLQRPPQVSRGSRWADRIENVGGCRRFPLERGMFFHFLFVCSKCWVLLKRKHRCFCGWFSEHAFFFLNTLLSIFVFLVGFLCTFMMLVVAVWEAKLWENEGLIEGYQTICWASILFSHYSQIWKDPNWTDEHTPQISKRHPRSLYICTIPIGSMGLVYLPAFTIKLNQM